MRVTTRLRGPVTDSDTSGGEPVLSGSGQGGNNFGGKGVGGIGSIGGDPIILGGVVFSPEPEDVRSTADRTLLSEVAIQGAPDPVVTEALPEVHSERIYVQLNDEEQLQQNVVVLTGFDPSKFMHVPGSLIVDALLALLTDHGRHGDAPYNFSSALEAVLDLSDLDHAWANLLLLEAERLLVDVAYIADEEHLDAILEQGDESLDVEEWWTASDPQVGRTDSWQTELGDHRPPG